MSRYINPKNFHELVEEMKAMEFGDWVENEDNNRFVELGNMIGAKYELYEDHEFIGGTSDVVAAAQFIAEGWNYKESTKETAMESAEEAARRRNREDFEESIANGWIYGQKGNKNGLQTLWILLGRP